MVERLPAHILSVTANSAASSERPNVGVAVLMLTPGNIVERINGKVEAPPMVLMFQRLGKHGNGTWAFPGGHVEYGESPLDCAKREVFEEVGLDIPTLDFSLVCVTSSIHVEEEDRKHNITVVYSTTVDNIKIPKIMEPHKHADLSYHYFEELPTPLFLPVQAMLANKDFQKWLFCMRQ